MGIKMAVFGGELAKLLNSPKNDAQGVLEENGKARS